MTNFKEALEQIDFCLKTIKSPHIDPKDNAIWSSGTSSRPRITEETLAIAHRALLIADRLMQEPSEGMCIAANEAEDKLILGEGVPLSYYSGLFYHGCDKTILAEAAKDVWTKPFKSMCNQMIREIEE